MVKKNLENKKIIGHRIEKIYNVNTREGSEEYHKFFRVNSRDPLMVEEDNDLIGFRFYDVDEGIIAYHCNCGVELPYNYSSMYYFGKRGKLEGGVDEEVIFCKDTDIVIYPVDSNDRTIEEVKLERIIERSKVIFISSSEFLNMVMGLLEEPELSMVIMTLALGVDNAKGNSTYIKLSDVIEVVKPLYYKYPYLEELMIDFMIGLFDKNAYELLNDNYKIKKGFGKKKIKYIKKHYFG